MAEHDVPGANPANGDALKMGCWAEHEDGSLIFVEGTENMIVFSIFDMSKTDPIEYRHAMAEVSFKTTFSWKPKSKGEKWLWHDKTPFPWDKVIKKGFTDGVRLASASAVLSAAERVAESLKLRGAKFDSENIAHRTTDTREGKDVVAIIVDKFARALQELVR